jgi:hypothetical protein
MVPFVGLVFFHDLPFLFVFVVESLLLDTNSAHGKCTARADRYRFLYLGTPLLALRVRGAYHED